MNKQTTTANKSINTISKADNFYSRMLYIHTPLKEKKVPYKICFILFM